MGWKGNDEIFRTYVKGAGKKPVERVKDRDHIADFDEVCGCKSFGAVLKPNIVDISFDTKELYETVLRMAKDNGWKCLALPSPKGGHTYWRCSRRHLKNGSDRKLTVGLIADIHSGSTYIPLKVSGEERFPPDYDPGEYQEVPDELLPIGTSVQLWKMEDGEGRNQELFRYIQRLQAVYTFSKETITRILKTANEYILADPLPETELDTILRDESFENPLFFDGKALKLEEFSKWLIEKHHIRNMNHQLCVYHDGIYVPGAREIERCMIEEIPGLKKTQRREVLEYIALLAEDTEPAEARYIAFKNGVLDIETGALLTFDPERHVVNQIPWDYNAEAYDEAADTMLDNVSDGDPSIRALLEECIGYCFFRRNELRKAFILTGGKRRGKSTFLDCVKAVLGDDNVSSLDLKEVGDRFSTAMLAGKLANIGDDISDDFLMGQQVATFKKIVAGNRIKAERKGQEPFDFDPYVKLLFSANEIPRIRDRGSAVMDRLIIIPFNAEFDERREDYKPFIVDDLKERPAMEYLVRLGVEGLKRVLTKDFTKSQAVDKRMEEYEEENNPVLAFIKNTDINVDIIGEPTKDVYRKYAVFCHENGLTPTGKIVFSRQLCEILKITSVGRRVNGRLTKVYLR